MHGLVLVAEGAAALRHDRYRQGRVAGCRRLGRKPAAVCEARVSRGGPAPVVAGLRRKLRRRLGRKLRRKLGGG